MAKNFQSVGDFLTIYISEAHAMDEWPYGNKICFKQPKTIEERLAIANKFVSETKYETPLVVDSIANTFESEFAAWPERFFILQEKKVIFIGEPGETFGFDLDLLTRQLGMLQNTK